MKLGRKILSIILALILLCCLTPLTSRAAQRELEISVPCVNPVSHQIMDWEYPYSDDYFRESSEFFYLDLARASLGLALSAFRNNGKDMEDQYETYLTAAGFTDLYAFGYDQETTKDTLSGVIGCKKIDDFILIAAAPCGQGYGKEWASNLEVGNEERHVGFNKAAQILERKIDDYIREHQLTGKMKLWLSGFSRAAAVSNLTAADMIDSGRFEDVYAYLYGVPRTTRAEDHFDYRGIYNICGKYDPVTMIPMETWGYERYGTDYYTPAQEMDSQYMIYTIYNSITNYDLTGDMFYFNPEINYQLHLIIEFLNELFPTCADYEAKFQDTIMRYWTEADPERIGSILMSALSAMKDLDRREAYSSEIFVDYLTYIMSKHLKGNTAQVDRGLWNPDQKIAENVLREHMPYTYICWMFSDIDLEMLFVGPWTTRRLSFFGNVDVEVWEDGFFLSGLDRNGEIYFRDSFEEQGISASEDILGAYYLTNVYIFRNGRQTVVNVPADGQYQVRVLTDGPENLIYYDVLNTPDSTFGDSDTMFIQNLQKGIYEMTVEGTEDLTRLTALEGDISNVVETGFHYSPTMVMSNESSAEEHINMGTLLQILLYAAVFVLALLLVCLVILIVHLIRRRRGHQPFSAWYIIVPHLLVIGVFMLLTQFFAVNMFSIGKTREICAGITMFVLFLLALRGFIRQRNIPNLMIAGLMLLLGFANIFLYQKSSLASSSTGHFILYCACIAGLTALTVSTFFRKRAEKERIA